MAISIREPRANDLHTFQSNSGVRSLGKHIVSAGFELECGIDTPGYFRLSAYVNERDLSEFYKPGTDGGFVVPSKEFENMEIRFHNTDLMVLEDFLRCAYEECGVATNKSCGFHVHIKFDDLAIAMAVFSSKEVVREFKRRYIERFGEMRYAKRLLNKSCRDSNLDEIEPVTPDGEIGYTKTSAINLGAYKKGTIEFRILPNQLTAEEATESLRWIIATANELYERHSEDMPCSLISISQAARAVLRANSVMNSGMAQPRRH